MLGYGLLQCVNLQVPNLNLVTLKQSRTNLLKYLVVKDNVTQVYGVSIGVLPVYTVHTYKPCVRRWTMKIRKIKCWFVNDDTLNKGIIHAQYIPKIIAKLPACLCFGYT